MKCKFQTLSISPLPPPSAPLQTGGQYLSNKIETICKLNILEKSTNVNKEQ